ncbi:hypothetical protein BJ878DRAFT_528029 [Calycina marina]|uniref:Uncharacterized protein n=1 Tax=Calycina marina TaxID=1763456 RepID=A0A9P8CAP3_9HELO|nr:hypothetical protein BJ878DRAFT_528029 [Calycina marina]
MSFSRGAVQIISADQSVNPVINPNFLLVDYYLDTKVVIAKWFRNYWYNEPIASMVTETSSRLDVLPLNARGMQWRSYFKSTFQINSHL